MPAPSDFTFDTDTNDPTCITMGTGSKVAALLDRSANGFDFEQATEADQPTLVDIGGVNVIFFDQIGSGPNADGQWLTRAITWETIFGVSGNLTAAVRIRIPVNPYSSENEAANQTNAIIGSETGLGAPVAMRRHSTNGNQVGLSVFNTGFNSQIHIAPAPPLDEWTDVVVRKDGTAVSIDVRPVGEATVKTDRTFTGTLYVDSGLGINFGKNSESGGVWWEGYLWKARIYDYALSDSETDSLFSEWDGVAPAYWPASLLSIGLG